MKLGLGIRVNWPSLVKFSLLAKNYKSRVVADNGIVESLGCVNKSNFSKSNWGYYFRVVEDGGIIESLECVTL
tara:strand:+ start:1345 stop:1563 length:219 start_codon:yes stop_codon:yes gene_type:complete